MRYADDYAVDGQEADYLDLIQRDGYAEGAHESSPSLLSANLASPKMKKGKTTKVKKTTASHTMAHPMTKSKTKAIATKKEDQLGMAQNKSLQEQLALTHSSDESRLRVSSRQSHHKSPGSTATKSKRAKSHKHKKNTAIKRKNSRGSDSLSQQHTARSGVSANSRRNSTMPRPPSQRRLNLVKQESGSNMEKR